LSPTFQDEVQLAGWSETHTGGAKVTFWLPDTAALDVFRTLTARKGNTAGHRFACVLVEIGDDEKPVQPDVRIPTSEKPKGGEWAKLAGMWCNDPDFWAFCNQNFTADSPMCHADHAALSLRVRCCIQSRAELDHNPEALELFQIHFRRPFMKWMISRGIQK
jgi:hypothetical protein